MSPDRSFSMGQTAASLAGFARATGLAGFWRWWAGELAPLVPSGARNAVARRRLRPVLAFDGNVATLWRPVMRDGAIVPGRLIELTLACDHRILSGADGAAFLARVRELLEHPVALLV